MHSVLRPLPTVALMEAGSLAWPYGRPARVEIVAAGQPIDTSYSPAKSPQGTQCV